MQLGTYHRNSLTYHRWSNLAVMMGVAVAAAVLIGALLVGDSMRGSLRETALRRLGPVDHALVGQRFFREAIAEGLASTPEFRSRFGQACPVMLITGGISHADTGARVNSVNVLGVDDRFWLLDDERRNAGNSDSAKRVVVLNEPLAEELGAKVGDDVLVRLQRRRLVPAETLLGRPDDVAMALRLTVDRIVPAAGMGGFSIRSNQRFPRNAFVPLPALQRATQQDGRVNAILVTGKPDAEKYPSAEQDNRLLQGFFKTLANPGDFDLRLRRNDALGYVSLETDRLLLEPAVEPEAFEAARAVGAPAVPILTYLANTIALMPAEKGGDGALANRGDDPKHARNDAPPAIPYSTVTAVDPDALPPRHALRLANGGHAPTLDRRDILLSRWAADDLRADVGDRVEMTFYMTRSLGRLETVEAVFAVRGIVAIEGWAADAGLTPEFEGITNVQRLSDWDPPFPIDMNRIREKDEQYWSQYRATPKAFVSRQAGRELWTEGHAGLGRLTSIRITAAPGTSLEETATAFEEQLRRRLDPEKLGLTFQPVREQAIASSRGSTDFGGLFTAMSFFLIASAGLIIAIMFRLGVTQRAVEIGTLLALGFRRRRVMRILLLEGTIVAAFGILAGSAGAIGYAWLMLAGLRSASWWAGAVNTPFLELHTTPLSFAIGSAVAFIVAMIAIAWAIRGLTHVSARALLAGEIQSGRSAPSNKGRRIASGATVFSFLAAGALIVTSAATDALPRTGAFFASGTLMLVASVLGLWLWLAREHRELIREPGTTALLKLGMRNMGRNRGRTLMTIALIASATFVIVAVGANRHGAPRLTDDKQSPTGGFGLICETAVPLHRDLNTVEGRDALGLADSSANLLASTTVMPFRLKPGDDASCLNLFRIDRPTILGAPPAMIDRGGFKFAALLDGHQAENAQNPWLLLRRRFDDGAVPAIVDFNTAVWLLHLGLGQDFTITDEGGQAVQLRIVAMLAGSILQGELIVSEAAFAEMFPSVEGYAFFLIDTPVENAGRLQHALEHDLNRYGFDAASAEDRLVEYMAVENTYISTFQTLGGLGLLLGTIGLAAVMLRNVTERRSEFALLRCIGYRQSSLCWMVLFENAALLVLGLVAGTVSALLAVAPHAATSPGDIPWVSLAGTLLAVALVGLATGTVAVLFSLRTQVLSSLRAE